MSGGYLWISDKELSDLRAQLAAATKCSTCGEARNAAPYCSNGFHCPDDWREQLAAAQAEVVELRRLWDCVPAFQACECGALFGTGRPLHPPAPSSAQSLLDAVKLAVEALGVATTPLPEDRQIVRAALAALERWAR